MKDDWWCAWRAARITKGHSGVPQANACYRNRYASDDPRSCRLADLSFRQRFPDGRTAFGRACDEALLERILTLEREARP